MQENQGPQWLLDLHKALGSVEAAVRASQQAAQREAELTRDSLREELSWLTRYVDSRIEDLKQEVFNRFKRQDAAIAATQKEDGPSPTSGRLRSFVGLVLALKDLPWRGLLFVMGAIFAFLGHLLPAELNTLLRQILLLR
jgi:hypothetical protein